MVADDNDNPFAYHIMDEVRRSSMPTYSRDLRPGKLLEEPIRVTGTYQASAELRDQILDSFASTYMPTKIVQPERVAKICDETAERWSSPIISVGPCEAVAANPRKLRIRK